MAESHLSAPKPRTVVGAQPVREALRAHGDGVQKLWLLEGAARLNGLKRLAESLGVPVREVARAELDRLSEGHAHQGAVCWAPPVRMTPAAELFARHTLILALDGIQDPQNFGAVLRSAVGIAEAAVLWGEHASAPLTPATFRASAGAIEHADLCRVASLPQALLDAQAAGFQIVGLDSHAEQPLTAVDLRLPSVLIVGGEGRGLSRVVRRHCTQLARLAKPRRIDSLNASVAAALALYEAQRQRPASEAALEPNPPQSHHPLG